MAVKSLPHLYRSKSDSLVPEGILINKDKHELKRRVTFSRVVILNNPTTFILVKEERGLQLEEEEKRRQDKITENDDAEERAAKGQKKGKSRQTTKRKQSLDEKKEKEALSEEKEARRKSEDKYSHYKVVHIALCPGYARKHGVFQTSFMTNGFSTSFTFIKIVAFKSLPSLTLQDLAPEDLNHFKIWEVDPGVKEVFVAVDSSDRAIYNASEVSSNAHHQMLWFSSSEYYVNAGFKKKPPNTRICQLKKDQGIDVLESGVTSPKKTQMDQINRYIADILDRLERLLTFYGVEFQRLKFLNYLDRQKVHNELINIFFKWGTQPPRAAEASSDPPAGPSTTRRNKWRKQEFQRTPEDIVSVVCLGDGNIGRRTFRGRPHGSARTLRRLLHEAENQGHLLSIDINERYASQVCSGCGEKKFGQPEAE
ncbi:hypothetical protein [Parasitella parasitica]|uniref:Uncharacterized protein n=1 Tax=Parasitella parasitica TaxID=35722 RepID=A0A0B7N8Y4_9FUNG|nr:hypothetical protein [Parasitella parasitica]